MPVLSNLPLKTKYSYLDNVFIWKNDLITSVVIDSYRVEVDNPNNDSTGRQQTFYRFSGLGSYEVEEDLVFSSMNHILFHIKNDDLNRAIESGGGANTYFLNMLPNASIVNLDFGSWTDFAGWNLSGLNMINFKGEVKWKTSELIFDAAYIWGAVLPAAIQNKSAFKATVKSYDRKSTLWFDENPIGI